MEDLADRIRALIQQALAEAQTHSNAPVRALHITLYENDPALPDAVTMTFEWASRDTPLAGARLIFKQAFERFICWNCCGLRFESRDGMCPNCGETGLTVPPEVAFGLERVELEPNA